MGGCLPQGRVGLDTRAVRIAAVTYRARARGQDNKTRKSVQEYYHTMKRIANGDALSSMRRPKVKCRE